MFQKVLSFSEFIKENANIASSISAKGLEFTNKIKSLDTGKPQYKHMPCYEFVYKFMKMYKPDLPSAILTDLKMAYKKDIGTLPAKEYLELTKKSLQVPSQPETMRGLEYVNQKYGIGRIVTVDQAKIGDAISFWVYQFIEFSRKEKNYSFPTTEASFKQYLLKNKLVESTLPEWLIEGARIEYGHYGIISDIDSEYLYLTSSGEKNGCNGIWNGVPKSECSENFTKIRKADLKKFQNKSFDDMLFRSTDELTNKRIQIIMRSYILNFI
jgi:hypothetical protein